MWEIHTTDRFDDWYKALPDHDRSKMAATMITLAIDGPALGRPYADSVYGSRFSNMKELRVQSKGRPLRALYAFDPERNAVMLCAGDKTGKDKTFYKKMLKIADQEFENWLKNRS